MQSDEDLDDLRSKIADLEERMNETTDQGERTAMRIELASLRHEKAVLMLQHIQVS